MFNCCRMMIPLFALLVLGTEERLMRDNARLSKTNAVLLKTLHEMEVGEELVGQSVKSTCQPLEGFRACTGVKHFLRDLWARRAEENQIFYGSGSYAVTDQVWCKLYCENMGIPGCCEWQADNEECQFTAFSSSTISDSGSKKVWGDGWDYTMKPLRYASVCSVSNCDVYQMEPVVWRDVDCDWDGFDKAGQRSKMGKGHDLDDCMNWCLNDPGCVFASRSSTGYCHSYKSCNHKPFGTGWITQQKVCKGALEYNNHENCPVILDDPKYCISPPF